MFTSTARRPRPDTPISPGTRSIGAWRDGSPSARVGSQQALLEGSHRRLVRRLRVIPATQMERPVRCKQSELVRRRPADIARLAAAALLGLLDRALDGDRDVADVGPSAAPRLGRLPLAR